MTSADAFFPELAPALGRTPLWSVARRYRILLLPIAFTGLIASLLEGVSVGLLIPVLSIFLTDRLPPHLPLPARNLLTASRAYGHEAQIFVIAGVMFALILLKGIVQAANNLLITNIDGRVANDIRNQLCERILKLDYSVLLSNNQSRLAHIIVNDSWYASEALKAVLTIVPAAVGLAAFGLMLIWLDWRLSLLAGGGAIIIEAALMFVEKRQRQFGRDLTGTNQILWRRMFGIINAMRTIRIFGLRKLEARKFGTASEHVRRSTLRIMQGTVTILPGVEVLISTLFIMILLYGYLLGISVPILTAYLVLLARAQPYAHNISRLRVEYASYVGSIDEINWLFEQKSEPASGRDVITSLNLPIHFEEVFFRYPDGTSALNGATFTLRANVATALIGKSGTGKSTIVDLLSKMTECQLGTIRYGERPINALDAEAWRARIGIAGQNVELVDGTIAENIANGMLSADTEHVKAAAACAGASAFIEALPSGYETVLGTGGFELSGGERQRIGLARALLRDPDLLILDEATSAVDALSERQIFSLLRDKRRGRTTLMISHRPSTLALCEEGIVLDEGKVVEAGSLESLNYFRSMTGQTV